MNESPNHTQEDVNTENSKEELEFESGEKEPEVIEKDFVPHFLPTYRVRRNLYPLPIIVVVIIAGLLAYATNVIAGVQIEGGYVSEEEYGIAGGIINGIIFTVMAAISSFIIIFLVKRKGINVLKYVFGVSFGFLGFLLTLFFGEIVLFLAFYRLPETQFVIIAYYISYYSLLIGSAVFTMLLIYRYFTSQSLLTKNFIVMYIGLLVGALLGVIMPLWTTLAILIGISLWDIYAVKSKRGPIKNMIDIASGSDFDDEETKQKLRDGEIAYDTSKLEIGIGDLAFYSMLTSSALIITGFLLVMILTALAIIVGTGITIQGLKRNKILPGLPISIFLGIATMLLSWFIISILM
ncbi:MAG: hypothetical protein GF383_08265 [Candidatus Lokiarchaeota archaeon]|nr:hypothetical protein [Candidatus Lokiarchaeota archaeon]MBD3340345.1 hypothetical protein [Candidatus Lokiarchaeota archaeon]